MGQHCVQGGDNRRPLHQPIDIEDCLNLNIFTPASPSNHHMNFPVLFYVHGGSFSSGSNREHPASYILEHNIVLVVPNYRLDALGNKKTCLRLVSMSFVTESSFSFRFSINKNDRNSGQCWYA